MNQPGSQILSRGGLRWIEHPLLGRYSWLAHAFSTRQGGVSRGLSAGLNLGFTEGEARARVLQNRRLFSRKLGLERFALASLRQVHSASVYQVRRAASGQLEYGFCGCFGTGQAGAGPFAGDALITGEAGVLLAIRTADCLPLILVDPKQRVVAAIHAGWRGALARIVEKTVGEMRRLYGSRPQNVVAVMGPSIRACCYEVRDEVVDAFRGRFVHAEKFFRKVIGSPESQSREPVLAFLSMRPPGHDDTAPRLSIHLDLTEVARDQLRSAGLAPRHIGVVDFCTACRTDLFYSHRREGSRTGRLMTVIGMRPPRSSSRESHRSQGGESASLMWQSVP